MKRLLLLTLFCFLPFNQSNAEEIEKQIAIVSGSPTGTYYRFAHDIKKSMDHSDIEIIVKESAGSIDNIRRIASNENAFLGIVQSDVLGFLTRSEKPESRHLAKQLRLMFPFYQEEVHILANKEINSVSDLEGKVISIGATGSGSWLTAMNIFKITGIKPQKVFRITPEKAVVGVLSNEIDAVIFVGGKPVKLFQNLDTLSEYKEYSNMLENVHFVPIKDKNLLSEYIPSSIEKDDYGFVKKSVPTIAVTAILVSYDFYNQENEYAKIRCQNLKKFSDLLRSNISDLKRKGHQKWKEVNLDAEINVWPKDRCISENAGIIGLENELFLEISQ